MSNIISGSEEKITYMCTQLERNVPVTMGFHISVEGWIGFGIQRQGRKNTA
jgi:hypothetical protein